jgi:signal transduction histidine kinase
VRDNGRGFDARQVRESRAALPLPGERAGRAQGGLGIASMRERLRAHSGELALESAPGHGTHVEVRLPR